MPSTEQQTQLNEISLSSVATKENILRAADTAIVLRLVWLITVPFEKWKAFKLGVIDDDGVILTKKQNRTPEQKASFTLFHRLARNVKKMLRLIPFGRTILGSFAASMFLIREMHENPLGRNLQERFETYLVENEEFLNDLYEVFEPGLEELNENVTTAAVQTPSFPIDVPYRPKKFMGMRVFDVPTERYVKSKNGKRKYTRYERYVGSDEVGEEIRQYGRQNPKSGIILRDEKSGSMIFLRKPH